MLSRPYQAQTSSADRTQVAAFYGLLGLFAGVVIVAVLACLYTLTQQMHDQNLAIEKLEKTVERTDQAQNTAMELLLEREKSPESPKTFLESLKKARTELQTATDSVKDKEILMNLAVAENRKLAEEVGKLKKANEEVVAKAKKEEKDHAEEHEKLREIQSELKAFEDTPAGQLNLKYSTALYAAITGWIVAILAGLGLLAMYLARTPLEDEGEPLARSMTVPLTGVTPPAAPPEEPPHQIV